MAKQEIGVIGMGVMGRNLALNIESAVIQYLSLTARLKKRKQLWKRMRTKN